MRRKKNYNFKNIASHFICQCLIIISDAILSMKKKNDAACENDTFRLEDEIPKLANRHRMFQQLRGYMTDLTDCYDEKVSE